MKSRLMNAMDERVLIFDGAMGTSVHNYELTMDDWGQLENCTDILCVTRPDIVQEIHESYYAAGSDIIETNTFGAMPHVLKEFDIPERCDEITVAARVCATKAAEAHETPEKPRFILGSLGPGTKLITLEQITWDELRDSYYECAKSMARDVEGVRKVDAYLVETCQDLLQIKAACAGIQKAQEELGIWGTDEQIPIMVSVTIEMMGTMLVGSSIEAAIVSLADLPIESLGMNCATGPREMHDNFRALAKAWPRRLTMFPNAGLPELVDGHTCFPLKSDEMVEECDRFIHEYGVNMIGGCCGTTPEHIGQLAKHFGGVAISRKVEAEPITGLASLYRPEDYRQDNSLLNIGERLNSSGSRRFKRLLEEENWDEMISLAREQMKEGSHVLDVNVDYAGRDSIQDMKSIVAKLVRQVDAPLMLDSTQPEIIEAGLQAAGAKCLINSANLEDGEEKFAYMCKLARDYGAGLVLGCIDEDPEEAMARTRERKLSIAERMYELATEKYGLAGDDLMFDPLVLPISTGMEQDRRSGVETIEGTRLIAERFPDAQITCGLSNISFGLNPAARQVMNSVFLHELKNAGMTSAIVHVSKILPKSRIPEAQWNAALNVIYDRRKVGGYVN